MADRQTINVYDDNIAAYKKMVDRLPDLEPLSAFINALPLGAKVLDWGCGPGYLAARMRDAGLHPYCIDASAQMVAAARNDYHLAAEQARFSDLNATASYDGIWANFSLLHAQRPAFAGHISAAAKGLVSSGWLYVSVKCGTGEKRDDWGRLYAYYSPDELETIIKTAGFQIIKRFTGKSAGLSGKPEEWIGLLSKKTH